MDIKLSEAETVVMRLLWDKGALRAVTLAEMAKEEKGWEKNTTYTLIHRLIKKNAVSRQNPGFICKPLIQEFQIRREETRTFLNRMYNGSLNLFVKSFLQNETVSEEELEELRSIINQSSEA